MVLVLSSHRTQLRQADATCTEADVANITAVGMPASLADRSRLIRMLEVTTRGCVRCILQTVASVCGDDCVKDKLHIRTGRERLHPSDCHCGGASFRSADSNSARGPVSMRAEDLMLKPQRCLEMLAQQLAKGEARAWAHTVETSEPFELSVWPKSGGRVADTYVPTDRVYGGSAVYRGIAGGLVAYACDAATHGPVWALSSAASDEAAWQRCEGDLWIDEEAGEAYSSTAVSRRSCRLALASASARAQGSFRSRYPQARPRPSATRPRRRRSPAGSIATSDRTAHRNGWGVQQTSAWRCLALGSRCSPTLSCEAAPRSGSRAHLLRSGR